MNISTNYYNNDVNELGDGNDPSDTRSILRNLKLKTINRLVLSHLNINSLNKNLNIIWQMQLEIVKVNKWKIENKHFRQSLMSNSKVF